MITNNKQTCIIHFVDCRKALHSYLTNRTRKYFGCERRRALYEGRHVVARVDVLHVLMFGDYLRGQRAAWIGQRKITQCAHSELWERPVLPGAAWRRNWFLVVLGPVSLSLMTSQFKDFVNPTKNKSRQNAYIAVYGFKILYEITKMSFEISHKILNPYIAN